MKNKLSSMSSNIIVKESEKYGIELTILDCDNDVFYLKNDKKRILFKNIDCGLNTLVAAKLVRYKDITYNLLNKINLPCPKSVYIEEAKYKVFDLDNLNLKYPLVVKPASTGQWIGVTVEIESKKRLKVAIENAFKFDNKIIIQEYIQGEDYRIVVVGDKVIAGTKRLPPSIIGDGIKNIRQLIDEENENPLRSNVQHSLGMSLIPINNGLKSCLEVQKLSLETTLSKGEKIVLQRNLNFSSGGRVIDITDNIHPDIKKMCLDTMKFFELRVMGIDILTTDISKSLKETGGVIIEINSTPSLRMHHFPSEWKSRNVGREILKVVFDL